MVKIEKIRKYWKSFIRLFYNYFMICFLIFLLFILIELVERINGISIMTKVSPIIFAFGILIISAIITLVLYKKGKLARKGFIPILGAGRSPRIYRKYKEQKKRLRSDY